MGFKLFVDDKRDRPKGFECARSYDHALMFYSAFGEFEFVDLDYDLNEKHTGLDILVWMKEKGKHPKYINIHSSHIEGVGLMYRYAEENFPDAVITLNTLD